MCDDSEITKILLVEPFHGGSHKQLIDFILNALRCNEEKYVLVTLPAKKWHWRARTSALFISKNIPYDSKYKALFCSSVLNLAELISLRRDLADVTKIIYFHENQFVYPRQCELDRDFQYGYNTILSALVANIVVFNSHYNKNTFLENISKHLRKQPDFHIRGLEDEIRPKCRVIYFPVLAEVPEIRKNYDILHIVWPHRWEHDKNPKVFFETMFKLKFAGVKFHLSVLGDSFKDPMPIFEEAKEKLNENIKHFGRLDAREEYLEVLTSAHVSVSTATHEFFGVAMMESVMCGCYPLVPNALVYPELYPTKYLYNTPQQLYKKLLDFCLRPYLVYEHLKTSPIPVDRYHSAKIALDFLELFSR